MALNFEAKQTQSVQENAGKVVSRLTGSNSLSDHIGAVTELSKIKYEFDDEIALVQQSLPTLLEVTKWNEVREKIPSNLARLHDKRESGNRQKLKTDLDRLKQLPLKRHGRY